MSNPQFDHLITTIKKSNPRADLDLIRRAYEFADEAHRGQLRKSGEPHINHSIATAQLLADWHLPSAIIAAGLLHDTPEDTHRTIKDIELAFGSDIAHIVEGETKLDRLKYVGIDRYVENLRKLFLAMAKDVRVVFVKFADRAHNLLTLDALPEAKRYRIARETLQIYSPIAGRLGMGEMKGLLEDLAFPYVYPKEHAWLTELVKKKFEEKKQHLKKVERIVKEELARAKIKTLDIHGRTKHLYSLYRKLLKRDRDLEKVYDLVALRIILKDVADCYAVLGVVHSRFKPLKGRIKDYIAQPKPNGYQSLHTTVFSDDGKIIEFQIRTKEMHDDAEYGIAAHWRYDEQDKKAAPSPRQQRWMDELARIQKELDDRKAFLETLEEMKIDLFENRIFVFTPKGDVLDLPEDSTPIDFAYAIHTDIGNRCAGARVNEELGPLDRKLNSGDIVEIITDAKRRGPSADWLKFAKTRNARSKIKAATRHSMTDWLRVFIPGKNGSKPKK